MNKKTPKKYKINEATPQSSRDGAAQEREEWWMDLNLELWYHVTNKERLNWIINKKQVAWSEINQMSKFC